MRSHKDLTVWQKSIDLVEKIYTCTEQFPQREMYGLAAQMRRAAVSISSNIAEGRSRGTRKDFAHFLHMAFGSSSELETQLVIAKRLQIGKANEVESSEALLLEVSKMLRAMIDKLEARS
ncbi:four helix bundle protein [Candidatus Kaiserbacteria bacterium RIFCSPLOWO2_01_FULL_54_13]|uniref:Four helix bundle protein n=1 Tax=Candidatus Kaiserbacteria bacterium RIFCSPLOWO2_01_FULL_54_13 TaxID=1798512 RepID=A0A1F6F0B8_9BACT|nr:MAG: four helix bundle protein [Candidatus Kaiserbacteria bacterium RIFCSPLOWO2_01_FULL_54_13]